MIKYDPNEKVSIESLRMADVMNFALLCERAGFLSTAFKTYVESTNSKGYARALKMIDKMEVEGVPKCITQGLIKKLREYYTGLSETEDRGNIYQRHNASVSRQRGREGLEWLNDVETRQPGL